MNDAGLLLNIHSVRVPKEGTLEERLIGAMRSARVDTFIAGSEDDLFRAAVGAVLRAYGEGTDEWERIAFEIRALKVMNAAAGGIPVDLVSFLAEERKGPEPVRLMALWDRSREPAEEELP